MAKDKSLCAKCQEQKIDYITSTTGKILKHGLCRDCYERGAGSGRTSNSGSWRDRRSSEQKEDTYETKYGTGHG